MKQLLIKIVDSFYLPIFRKFIPLQTFRYGVCGGINLIFDALLYLFFFNVVLKQQNFELPFVVISPQIAAFLFTFPIIFFTGFYLSKNVSFEGRKGRSSEQSVKYLAVVVLNIAVKYWGINFLTLVALIYPSIANVVMTVVTVIISYLLQNYFTFRGRG
ncbi:MAG: GtrA family protein [Rikenellaceae bacterium]